MEGDPEDVGPWWRVERVLGTACPEGEVCEGETEIVVVCVPLPVYGPTSDMMDDQRDSNGRTRSTCTHTLAEPRRRTCTWSMLSSCNLRKLISSSPSTALPAEYMTGGRWMANACGPAFKDLNRLESMTRVHTDLEAFIGDDRYDTCNCWSSPTASCTASDVVHSTASVPHTLILGKYSRF